MGIARHYPSLRRGSLDSSSSSLDDFSGLQRRRLSASSLDDDPPTQRWVSDSSLDDPPALLEPPARRPKMISSQTEQRLLAAEIDTSETSAPSTPEPFASHLVKIPGINSRQEDAGGAISASSSLNHTSTSTDSFHFAAGPKVHISDVPNSPAVGADSRRLSTIGTSRYTNSFEQNSGNFVSHRRSSLDSTQSLFDGRIDGITDHRYPRAGPSSEGIAGATKANNTDFGPPGTGPSHFSSTAANPTSVTISGPGGSARITGADPSAGSTTHGNIASRRAMRMKQALSTSSGKPARLNEMTLVGSRPAGTLNRRRFRSTKLRGEIYKPSLKKQDLAMRWAR